MRKPLDPLPDYVMNLPVSQKVPNTFAHHVILYAKNWYGQSGNVISDLKELLSVYSNMSIDYIHDRDVLEVLVSTFAEYVHKFELSDGIYEMVYGKYQQKRTPEQIMVGKISTILGEYCDPCKRLPVLSFKESPENRFKCGDQVFVRAKDNDEFIDFYGTVKESLPDGFLAVRDVCNLTWRVNANRCQRESR